MPARLRTLTALLGLALLAGCSGTADGDAAPPAETSASASPSETETADGDTDESEETEVTPGSTVADRLPAGELTTRLDVEVKRPRGDQLLTPSVTFTDAYVVALTTTLTLRVVDRATFQEVWSSPLDSGDASGRCPLPELARDAERVTLFNGLHCERILTYDLATGTQLSDTTAPDEWVTGYGLVGEDRTWWSGRREIMEVGEDGSSAVYADLDALGVTDPDTSLRVRTASQLDESDVVLMHVEDLLNEGDPEASRLVGIDVGGETPEVLFDLPLTETGLPGGAPPQFELLQRPGALWRAELGDGGYALGSVDPTTGSVAERTVVLPSQKQGLTMVFDFEGENSLVTGTAVLSGFSAKPATGLVEDVVRYDLEQGTETWRSRIAPTRGQPKTGVGVRVLVWDVAADGQHAYATYSAGGLQTDLVELDLATGAETGRWPDIEQEILGAGQWFVDGDLLVGVEPSIALRKHSELVVKQAG